MHNLYDRDFYAWTQEQAELLRHQHWQKLDLPNLIEEIESLGKQQRQELRNRLIVLIGHLLKWHFQPEQRSRSWLATIQIQRLDLLDLVQQNPSLKPYLQEAVQQVYQRSVKLAGSETNLSFNTFPAECPYSFAEILSDRFYPGMPSPEWEEEF